MVAEIILVSQGAQAADTRQNAQYVARGLSAIGYKVREQISVCESAQQLQQAVAASLKRSHVLLTIGGLGKMSGYMAKNTVARGLGLQLEVNTEALEAIRSYCQRTGEPYSKDDTSLAGIPRGSKPFPPAYGKIPGYVISSSRQHIIMLPETQNEIIPMFNKYVSPYLGGASTTTVTRTVRTYGASEKAVRDALTGMLSSSNPVITVQTEDGEVLVRVTAHAESNQHATAMCTPALRSIVGKIGDAAYGLDVDSLQSALVSKLAKKEYDIAIAESGTGGMFTRVITETEGGQQVLRYSVAADDDSSKVKKLELVARKLKKRGGGVSEYAAVAMADAARQKAGTNVGIAITASTEDTATRKCPPGLVYIAVCNENFVYVKQLVIGDGEASDDIIVDAALSRALNMARLFVDYLPRRYSGAIPLSEALEGRTVTDKESYDTGADILMPDDDDYTDDSAPKGGALKKFIVVLFSLIFVVSAGYIGFTMYKSYEAKKIAEELNNMFEFGEMGDVELSEDYPKDYQVKFAGLWNVNPDVVAFIQIEDTGVKYPIVQSTDNDYYLRRDFYEQSNQHGVPFMDFRVNVKAPSDNLVVYGHNMKDGTLFGEIANYKEFEYYREHPLVNLSTVYEDGQYKIFSIFTTNAYPAQGAVFDYYNFIDAENNTQFQQFLDQLKARSMVNTTVDVQPGDELITLSTCTYEFKDARLVVVARKLRRGEDATVDVANAVENPQPLYPDIWYSTFGGTKPEGIDPYWTVGENANNYVAGVSADGAATPEITNLALNASSSSSSSKSSSSDVSEDAANLVQSRREQSRSSQASESELAEQSQKVEASRLALESSKAAEQSRKESEAEESRKASQAAEASSEAMVRQLALESSKAVEESRLALESSKAAEESRLAAEAAEESRKASEAEESKKAAEESRKASEAEASKKAAEESRLAVEQAALTKKEEVKATPASVSYSANDVGTLTVISNGKRITDDAFDIIAGVVQNEVGSSFNEEAIKAQAVASYTYISQSIAAGSTPSVYTSSNVSSKVQQAVSDVLGEAIYYNGSLAFTPYHATSSGATTSSSSVWGGSYPYLVSVDSSVDRKVSGFEVRTTMPSEKVASLLESKLGVYVDDDPSSWFEILSYTDGDYIDKMAVCGETKSKSGSTITGRLIRETVLNLRSANFDIEYDSSSDKFTFTTYGYGHGVGMSQNGANAYASQGWSYVDILEHYYPGTSVQ